MYQKVPEGTRRYIRYYKITRRVDIVEFIEYLYTDLYTECRNDLYTECIECRNDLYTECRNDLYTECRNDLYTECRNDL